VDHIRPHRGEQSLFFDRANLQGLCKPCHDRKTTRHDGGFGNPRIPRTGRTYDHT
jgi:5-methylcytosine-specific restriction protein A